MDGGCSNAYVARVNLLLLLSAMLSALTGVVTGGRVGDMPQAVCRAAQMEAVQPASVAKVATRPAQAIVSLVDVARATLAASIYVAAAVPTYASRRRE